MKTGHIFWVKNANIFVFQMEKKGTKFFSTILQKSKLHYLYQNIAHTADM